MEGFSIRKAKIADIPFLVETIIEAEKSGTDIFSYSTVFGLSESDAKKYISDMLMEDTDGCELSVSSFLVAENEGQTIAASSAWIEGIEGLPSAILKGNLLKYVLPCECFERALMIKDILREMYIECLPETIQIGLVYVVKDFRGRNLVSALIGEQIRLLLKEKPGIRDVYVQVFGNNQCAIRAYEKVMFQKISVKETSSPDVFNYLPSDSKVLMRRRLLQEKSY